jgi:hypothetical protein
MQNTQRNKFSILTAVYLLFVTQIAMTFGQTLEIADGVWVFQGEGYSINAQNKGRVTNIGFIETPDSGIIINTGISHNHASQVIETIVEISSKEKIDAVITQGAQKFALGAFSLTELGIQTFAHPRAASQMQDRCIHCIEYLEEVLGRHEMKGTQVDNPQDIYEMGKLSHRPLRDIVVIYHEDTISEGVIMIYHSLTETLFSGDVVFSNVIPNVKEANLKKWKKSLQLIRKMPISVIVPATGPLLTKSSIDDSLAYLNALEKLTGSLYDKNLDLLSATQKGELTEFSNWALYNKHHINNVMYRYLKIEEKELGLEK